MCFLICQYACSLTNQIPLPIGNIIIARMFCSAKILLQNIYYYIHITHAHSINKLQNLVHQCEFESVIHWFIVKKMIFSNKILCAWCLLVLFWKLIKFQHICLKIEWKRRISFLYVINEFNSKNLLPINYRSWNRIESTCWQLVFRENIKLSNRNQTIH